MAFLASLFDATKKDLKRARPIVERINRLEPEMQVLTDAQLRAKTDEFRARIAAARERLRAEWRGGDEEELRRLLDQAEEAVLDEVLPEAFALVREAAVRTVGMRHFDVQLIGGCVLHWGKIAEMRTGEGKTLVATLPLYLNALVGRGAHLVTHNDYLARRDREWMGPIYEFLGLTVGVIQHDQPAALRRQQYECDITHATNSEVGFDYLRDNTAPGPEYLVLRELYYAIVDEVDSLLVDEARVPLILAGPGTKPTQLYQQVDQVVRRLTPETDYAIDEKSKAATLTDDGLARCEAMLNVTNLSDPENLELYQHVNAALRARACYRRDVDYVVNDGQVIIIDEFTGRPMHGRRYSEGLHQAIEAKEGVKVERESQTVATITHQNLYRLYHKLAGMTGTAKTEEQEFIKVYGMPVVVIPTNKPMIRSDQSDVIYKTEEAKFRGILGEILHLESIGRPALVGTRSIEISERLSERLQPDRLQLFAQLTLLEDRLRDNATLTDPQRREFRRVVRELLDDTQQEARHLEEAVTKFDDSPQRLVRPEEERRTEYRLRKAQSRAEVLSQLAEKLGSSEQMSGGEVGRMAELICYQKLEEVRLGRIPALLTACGLPSDPRDPANVRRLAELIGLGKDPGQLRELLDRGIPHQVLNAKYHEQEAQIIAQAGRFGTLTIATNMAGRGVDILLGGNPQRVAQELLGRNGSASPGSGGPADKKKEAADSDDGEPTPEQLAAAREEAGRICAQERQRVLQLGGLHILGTERHESRRIDNQLRGRAGRQGDPGSSRFYVSFEDELLRLFGPERLDWLLSRWSEAEPVEAKLTSRVIENAQRKVEAHNFEVRKHRLQYDDVMNLQREVIYRERRQVLEGQDMRGSILNHMDTLLRNRIREYANPDMHADDWNLDGLFHAVNEVFPVELYASPERLQGLRPEQLEALILDAARRAYEAREQEMGAETMRELERLVTLRVVDTKWIDHLEAMEYLEEGIGLRGYSGVDPIIIYRKEAYDYWQRLLASISEDIVKLMFRVELVRREAPRRLPAAPPRPVQAGEDAQPTTVRAGHKVGRNDPCPCGSGRKYKKCCGRSVPSPSA
jgi:preprotein translocase subunit SecA